MNENAMQEKLGQVEQDIAASISEKETTQAVVFMLDNLLDYLKSNHIAAPELPPVVEQMIQDYQLRITELETMNAEKSQEVETLTKEIEHLS